MLIQASIFLSDLNLIDVRQKLVLAAFSELQETFETFWLKVYF